MTRETLTRREFAGAAVSLAALPGLTSTAAAQPVSGDPVLPLYAEWLDTEAGWKALSDIHDDWDRPEMVALMNRNCDLALEMGRIVPTTGAGIAALVHVLWQNDVGPQHRRDSPDYAAEFWQPQNRLVFSIWQAASGLPLTDGPFPIPTATADLEA